MPACFACQHLARVLPLLHRKYSKDSQPWCVCECRAARSLDAKNPLSRVTSPRGGIKRLVFPFGALIGAIPGGARARVSAFARTRFQSSNPRRLAPQPLPGHQYPHLRVSTDSGQAWNGHAILGCAAIRSIQSPKLCREVPRLPKVRKTASMRQPVQLGDRRCLPRTVTTRLQRCTRLVAQLNTRFRNLCAKRVRKPE